MTNFIFKSQGTYKKLCLKLDIIQSELRHQRADNQQILFLLNKLLVNKTLQDQTDEYFTEDEVKSFSVTSLQTEQKTLPGPAEFED